MKLKQLESALGEIEDFGDKPKINLEQYVTPPHVAARMLHIAREQGDIEDKIVCDLGAGTGALSIGSALLEASFIFSIEIDQEAIDVLNINTEYYEVNNIEPIKSDIFNLELHNPFIDTIVMNPPFGTRNKGADIAFIETGLKLSNTVYSLHKTSTRNHIIKSAERLGAQAFPLACIRYPLPKTYAFHSKQNQDIEVDFFKFLRS